MTPEQEARLNKLAETVRGMNMVPSGISLVGGFPTLPKNVSGLELLQHIEKAHENFALRGDKNVTIEGNIKTGLAINVRCPPQAAGGLIPPSPPPSGCFMISVTASASFGELGSCSGSGSNSGCGDEIIVVTGCDIGCIDDITANNYQWSVTLQLTAGTYILGLSTSRADGDPCVDSISCGAVTFDLGANPAGVYFQDLGENCFSGTGWDFQFNITITSI